MQHIVIISSSVRIKRNSHRVATYFKNYLQQHSGATAEIADLGEYNFALFNERLSLQEQATGPTLDFANKIKSASGIIIVTPEYNGGYPAALKNVLDLLYKEWYHKPVAIATVSSGPFGGSQAIVSLQFSLWKMQALTVPAMFPVPNVQDAFDENGVPADMAGTNKRAERFIKELFWCMDAAEKMKTGTKP